MFIAALFTITKIWKLPMCPSVDEWIEQLWDIYTMECYLAKKEESFILCDSMDVSGEPIMLSEISQSEKNKYRKISLISGI